jgi:release factor glutamine methyltransferase
LSSIYEPQEDSALLAKEVRLHARGRTLDLGTGSGEQAFAALERVDVSQVVAVDVNPDAVATVSKRAQEWSTREASGRGGRTIVVLKSDMFTALNGERFDTIICNPPYLPDEEGDKDPALYGGRSGYEWSQRFLEGARDHLAPGGQILFLLSSLTNRDPIDLALKRLGYHHAVLAELAMFFERLYVYRIWRPHDATAR